MKKFSSFFLRDLGKEVGTTNWSNVSVPVASIMVPHVELLQAQSKARPPSFTLEVLLDPSVTDMTLVLGKMSRINS